MLRTESSGLHKPHLPDREITQWFNKDPWKLQMLSER